MDLAAWSIETSSAKVKQMPFSVGTLLEICSSDKIYGSMNKKKTHHGNIIAVETLSITNVIYKNGTESKL